MNKMNFLCYNIWSFLFTGGVSMVTIYPHFSEYPQLPSQNPENPTYQENPIYHDYHQQHLQNPTFPESSTYPEYLPQPIDPQDPQNPTFPSYNPEHPQDPQNTKLPENPTYPEYPPQYPEYTQHTDNPQHAENPAYQEYPQHQESLSYLEYPQPTISHQQNPQNLQPQSPSTKPSASATTTPSSSYTATTTTALATTTITTTTTTSTTIFNTSVTSTTTTTSSTTSSTTTTTTSTTTNTPIFELKKTVLSGDVCPNNTQQATLGDKLTVHYEGHLNSNHFKFDSSIDRQKPVTFELKNDHVIQGWVVGLVGTCPGQSIILEIPSAMAYGSKGKGVKIPPNADVVFEIKLISLEKPSNKYTTE